MDRFSLLLFLLVCGPLAAQSTARGAWPTAGGDPGGQRYSDIHQINKSNVDQLAVAWTFHTGAIHWITDVHGRRVSAPDTSIAAFESTPILFNGLLYIVTPGDEILALDPGTGQQHWRYNPHIDNRAITSRGIAPWQGSDPSAPCGTRVFLGTLDARLLAVDARTGQPCVDFGDKGSVNLRLDVDFRKGDYYGVNSPPVVVGNVVIVGSAIQDNDRVNIEKGDVRAYDAVSGKLVWTWDPIPWAMHQKVRTGAGNAWTYLSADPEHGIVYIPTGSASPDFYGGLRPGDDRDADSVVALEAATGKRLWGFQTTHHNLWDYDVASQPLLFLYRGSSGSESIPAVAITTKMGMIFVLNRLTGAPILPVTERPVPQTDVAGETTSPTQPFSSLPTLSPLDWPIDQPMGADAADDRACRQMIKGLRYEGIYTPPSIRGSLLYPGNLGGVNWGSAAFDPVTGLLYANTNRYAFSVRLIPHTRVAAALALLNLHARKLAKVTVSLAVLLLILAVWRRGTAGAVLAVLALGGLVFFGLLYHFSHKRGAQQEQELLSAHFGKEDGPQSGTPYAMERKPLLAPSGHPCTPQPWGTVSAVNLYTGKAAWQTPLGTLLPGVQSGTLSLGGPIVTAGGLVFTAGSSEPWLRAYDAATGAELWKTPLPVPAQSTPSTYLWKKRQYLVVSAGGHGWFGTPQGDAVIAYALP